MKDDKTLKIIGLGAIIVIAIGALVFSVVKNATPEKEEVVGTLDMGPQGGREAERGGGASDQAGAGGQETGVEIDLSKGEGK